MTGARDTWLRRAKWTIYALTAAAVGYLAWVYDVDRIPDDYPHLTPQHMPPGAAVLTRDHDGLPIGVGSVLIYEVPGHDGRMAYGVVAGLPGETIAFGDVARGEPAATVGGRAENLILPAQHRIPAGEIPPGHYLVLNGDRMLTEGRTFPDSRLLGLVPADRIRKKVVAALGGF